MSLDVPLSHVQDAFFIHGLDKPHRRWRIWRHAQKLLGIAGQSNPDYPVGVLVKVLALEEGNNDV